MAAGVVLVHGYTGSPEDLRPLVRQLTKTYGKDSVKNITLPGHDAGHTPDFDKAAFDHAIQVALESYVREKRKIILLGHSTGGSLVLSFLSEHAFAPDYLILASTPKRIDGTYLDRWKKHRTGKNEIPISSIAGMVSLINKMGSRQFAGTYPVLLIHGEQDDLVPFEEAFLWQREGFEGPARTVIVPFADHHLFHGPNELLATDIVMRAVSDVVPDQTEEDKKAIHHLTTVEPESRTFLTASPLSGPHLARCPSGKLLFGGNPSFSPVVMNEPVMANIEITTHCNLRCKYCARAIRGRDGRHMPAGMFSRVLELLPHAYRITLVGLGEPLLHPHVVDFVAEASSLGRRVTIVTNAMNLEPSLSEALIQSGLDSLVFSIDAPVQNLASDVRAGTDLDNILMNIRRFISIAAGIRPVATAVFSAVSVDTAPCLVQLADLVSRLGVNVWMLTDLNYSENGSRTLWKNPQATIIETVEKAVRYAFSRALPVLSVHGLEEFGLPERYRQFLLLPPGRLYRRSASHTWCHSPWQTLPIDVRGNATICDCQPESPVGNLLTQPLSMIWNGNRMVNHRRRMHGPEPPAACRICPRF